MQTGEQEERHMETVGKGGIFTELGGPDAGGDTLLPRTSLGWERVAWWACALLAASAAAVLLYAYPAFAQAGGDIDTCAQGAGAVGGEGGQKILSGIKNMALFAAAAVGSISILGLIASAAMVILGSASKDWQRRGFTGLTLCGVGIFVALGAASLYGLINWAICGG